MLLCRRLASRSLMEGKCSRCSIPVKNHDILCGFLAEAAPFDWVTKYLLTQLNSYFLSVLTENHSLDCSFNL